MAKIDRTEKKLEEVNLVGRSHSRPFCSVTGKVHPTTSGKMYAVRGWIKDSAPGVRQGASWVFGVIEYVCEAHLAVAFKKYGLKVD